MLKRQARLRREFIYRRSIEVRDAQNEKKKKMLKAALAEGKTLPREIQEDALQLNEELDWSDDGGEGVVTSQDDEYLWAGTEDPRVVVTTSRSPSSKLKEFAKELRFLIPNATKINRGNYLNKNLLEACLAKQIMISTIILRFSLVLIHHTYKYVDKKLELTEHGPSFDLRYCLPLLPRSLP
ncbi:U3 small nucleolar ribonucleoprotein IMP4 [Schistosoma japonicum]|nr:U3 small nucleolar ribonucleoprotein IMP4 [Schistosoma japonicum]